MKAAGDIGFGSYTEVSRLQPFVVLHLFHKRVDHIVHAAGADGLHQSVQSTRKTGQAAGHGIQRLLPPF